MLYNRCLFLNMKVVVTLVYVETSAGYFYPIPIFHKKLVPVSKILLVILD